MPEPNRVAVIGLESMGFGMAQDDDSCPARAYAQPSGAKLP